MGKVQHAAAQAQQQQLTNASIVFIVQRDFIAGRFSTVSKALWQCQRGDDLEGLPMVSWFWGGDCTKVLSCSNVFFFFNFFI